MSESGGIVFPIPLWADLLIAAGVTAISAFFAGTTLGLLSLDKVGLQIVAQAGDTEKEKEYAKKILPIREKGNWLLCTLLIGNTVANSFLSILLASVSTGVIGLLVSTALIVLVAEIIPQSVCSRHGLFIGAHTTWLIKAAMAILAPVAWPLAYLLDLVLGREVGTIYSRQELKHLITIHVESKEHQQESGLDHEDHQLLSGALDYKDKRVKDVMTRLEKVFMLEAGTKLTFEHMLEIYRSGYTRIPVYDANPQNIIGILYTKDLILVDPDDELELRTLVAFQGKATVQFILDSTPLNEVFKLFKTNYTHLLVACHLAAPPSAEDGTVAIRSQQNFLMGQNKVVTGVITLEDVLEEVIQDEIVDESDQYETNEQSKRVERRGGRDRPDVAAYLALFEHKIRDHSKLSVPEVQAVAAFLSSSVKEFAVFTHADAVLKGLIRQAELVECGLEDSSGVGDEDDEQGVRRHPSQKVLYRRGLRSCHFTLILQGHVRVKAGTEGFPSELGPWSTLGAKAMGLEPYIPDFEAVSVGPCRLLRIHTDAFRAALRMGQANEIVGMRAIKQVLSHTHMRSLSGIQRGPLLPRPASDSSPVMLRSARTTTGEDSEDDANVVVSDEEESVRDVEEKPPKAPDAGRPGGLPPLHPLKH